MQWAKFFRFTFQLHVLVIIICHYLYNIYCTIFGPVVFQRIRVVKCTTFVYLFPRKLFPENVMLDLCSLWWFKVIRVLFNFFVWSFNFVTAKEINEELRITGARLTENISKVKDTISWFMTLHQPQGIKSHKTSIESGLFYSLHFHSSNHRQGSTSTSVHNSKLDFFPLIPHSHTHSYTHPHRFPVFPLNGSLSVGLTAVLGKVIFSHLHLRRSRAQRDLWQNTETPGADAQACISLGIYLSPI